QKDLTRFCAGGPACATSGIPPSAGAQVVWQFDDTAWSGMNTGDACVLYDTDGDGNANKAVCVTVVGAPGPVPPKDTAMMQAGSPHCYTCADDNPIRCTNSVAVACTSTCAVDITAADPFAGNPAHTGNVCKDTPGCLAVDTKVTCCVTAGDDGGQLIDGCAYPSQQPDSAPSDCVINKPCTSSSQCRDGDACTTDTCNPTTSVCEHGTLVCNDNNACTTDSCNTATGCVFTNNTNSCNDGNACTTNDT